MGEVRIMGNSIDGARRVGVRSRHRILATLVSLLAFGACDSAGDLAGPLDPDVDLSRATLGVVSGDGQEAPVGSVAPESLAVRVLDESGNPVPGAPLEWTFTQGRGRSSNASGVASDVVSTTTNQEGVSAVQWELGTQAGVQQAEVTLLVSEPDPTLPSGVGGAPGNSNGKKVGFQARAKPAGPADVTISPDDVEAQPGTTVSLAAQVTDQYGNAIEDANVSWSTSDESVARVDASGTVTTVGEGSTQVVAKSGPVEGTAAVTVEPAPAPDPANPGTVSDLRVVGTTETTVTLRWTQVADGSGGASDYALRTGTPTLTWGDASASEVTVTGTTVGQSREYTWSGLASGATHQFRLVAFRGTLGSGAVFGGLSNTVSGTTDPEAAIIAEVRVSPSGVTLVEGEAATFSATAFDESGAEIGGVQFEWRSTDVSVLTVDENGRATALSSGTARVVASANGTEGAQDVEVVAGQDSGELSQVSVAPDQARLTVGDSLRLQAVGVDGSGQEVSGLSFTWESSNDQVVSVTSGGVMRARSVGSALVVASVICGTSACSDTVAVTVDADTPGTVSDLRVTGSTETSVTVAFTQVTDGAGGPASYALRYGSPSISWGEATPTEVTIEGTGVGSTRVFEYSGLPAGADIQFQAVAYRGELGDGAEYGELSNVAAGSTASAPLGEPSSLTVSPARATIHGLGRTTRLVAEVSDLNGNVISGAPVIWSSLSPGIASVSPEGVVTSNQLGVATIVASLACGGSACSDGPTGSADVSVEEQVTQDNEPAGFTQISETGFDSVGEDGWNLLYGTSGQDIRIVTDDQAPVSPGNVAAVRLRAGLSGGYEPIRLARGGWSAQDVYIAFWFKLSDNWIGHSSGVNKIFFLTDDDTGNAGDPLYFSAQGSGTRSLHFQVRSQGSPGGTINFGWDSADNEIRPSSSAAEVVRGEWQLIEVLIRGNSAGQSNGEIHAWIDGTKILQFTNEHLLSSGDGQFDSLRWEAIWGGVGGSVSSEMYQYIDHIYVSGGS